MYFKTSLTAILAIIFVTPEVFSQDTTSTSCQLPAHPRFGIYTISAEADPFGNGFISASVTIQCNPGYVVIGKTDTSCKSGVWEDPFPTCARACKLSKHPSVDYKCVQGSDTRPCQEFELGGTIVKPVCSPFYYYHGLLPPMHCTDGTWNYVAVCLPECGVLPAPEKLDGRAVVIPWHVTVYVRRTKLDPYQTCGGSIISNTIVVSAASCFWDILKEEPSLPTGHMVAAGKRDRRWDHAYDNPVVQKRSIQEIKLHPSFQGETANLINNLAIVFVTEPFVYNLIVKPICMDFDPAFESGQMQAGNLVTVPYWDQESDTGYTAHIRTAYIPFISQKDCTAKAGVSPAKVTSDKFCIGSDRGVRYCERNSGTGVVFPERERGTTRYFLRGVMSSIVKSGNTCNATVIAVTQLSKHEDFIRSLI